MVHDKNFETAAPVVEFLHILEKTPEELIGTVFQIVEAQLVKLACEPQANKDEAKRFIITVRTEFENVLSFTGFS